MILARCPHCETVFRPSAEALGARHGKVRCGKCRKAFNALDHLIEEAADATTAPAPATGGFQLVAPPSPPPAAPLDVVLNTDTDAAPLEDSSSLDAASINPASSDEPVATEGMERAPPTTEDEATADDPATATIPADAPADPLIDTQRDDQNSVRETRDIPGYDKWAEGTFMGGATVFEPPKRTHWLGVVLALLLTLLLLAQLLYVFRTEVSARWPDARPWIEEACLNLQCTVPYPKNADLIDIQASELQADPARGGLLVLYLTLQNRSVFAQAYPSVELTLTDLHEQVVVRRVLAPSDWLPQSKNQSPAFAGNGEVAARLWLDPKDTGAVGYSLKVIYP